MRKAASTAIAVLAALAVSGASAERGKRIRNSIGMELVEVPAGRFTMGSKDGFWDQRPAHKVTITRPLRMSVTEVTADQYRRFRPRGEVVEAPGGFATGVSWYDAAAFCRWLSRKEGTPYRLPTEAEWEYACRAGTDTPFWSGGKRPATGRANPWGLKNMHTGPREWCLDWYGEYPAADQVDPAGAAHGLAKVVRGGGLDSDEPRYATAASRAGIAPAFGIPGGVSRTAAREATAATRRAKDQQKPGLIGVWFGSSNLTRPKQRDLLTATDNDWSRNTVRGTDWSARWRGTIEAPFSGEVTFEVEADSGVILNVAGRDVIAGWRDGSVRSGKLSMVKRRRYPVVLSYRHRGGRSHLRLYWGWAGRKRALVPPGSLSHGPADARAAERFPAGRPDGGDCGRHAIGFRVVQAPPPKAEPPPYRRPFVQQGVKPTQHFARRGLPSSTHGPAARKPYFRKRHLLPTPPETGGAAYQQTIVAAGLHPSFRGHNHSPALEVCPNGDVLMVIYSSHHEYEPEVSLIASRLRFGADQWDMPSRLFDFPGVNDHAPLLWNDGGKLHCFWGNPRLSGAFPFQWTTSTDSGATWSEVRFPYFPGPIGSHSRQPINTAFRSRDGTMYVPSDGAGGTSVLWASKDNGATWYDTGGRTHGRHTTFVLLSDGGILGMGGKNTNIDGYMPKSVSRDGGRTWTKSRTPFSWLGFNQRPSVLRLASGRLLFAGDFQCTKGGTPKAIGRRGSLVALSDDEGRTWRVKPLPGAQPHENARIMGGAATLGYSVARQAPNGTIHLITTMNRPCLHFEMNEAWIASKEDPPKSDAELMASTAATISNVRTHTDTYPGGGIRFRWSAGTGDDGRYLLHGTDTWYYRSGRKHYEATYRLGRKTGRETLWRPDGSVEWQWDHKADGTSVWRQWWPNGRKKAESTWRSFKCFGVARRWDRAGRGISEKELKLR